MGIEARITELGDLLCEQFHTVGGVAEDDGLIDLKFREEGVETVNLLLLLHKRVVLGNTTEGKFVHKIYLIGIRHMFVLH